MTDYIRITSETLHWFRPFLTDEEAQVLENDRTVYAIGAVKDEVACGVLVFQVEESYAEIRYILVADDYRRQKVATGMVEYLCRHAWASVTPVVCYFAASGMDDPVYLFFVGQELFSVVREEGYCCRASLAGIAKNPHLTAMRSSGGQPFFSLPGSTQRKFLNRLRSQNLFYMNEIDEARYCKPLCMCSVGASGVDAVVFLAETEDGQDLELTFAWCVPGHQRQLMEVFAAACEQLPEREGDLRIAAINPASAAIVDKLIPQREITDRYYRAAWDVEI